MELPWWKSSPSSQEVATANFESRFECALESRLEFSLESRFEAAANEEEKVTATTTATTTTTRPTADTDLTLASL